MHRFSSLSPAPPHLEPPLTHTEVPCSSPEEYSQIIVLVFSIVMVNVMGYYREYPFKKNKKQGGFYFGIHVIGKHLPFFFNSPMIRQRLSCFHPKAHSRVGTRGSFMFLNCCNECCRMKFMTDSNHSKRVFMTSGQNRGVWRLQAFL